MQRIRDAMNQGGLLPRKTIFGCCMGVSGFFIFFTGLLIGSVNMTGKAVAEICERLQNSHPMLCQVDLVDASMVGGCDDTCPIDDWGGLGAMKPGMLGLGDGGGEENFGDEYTDLLQDSKACSLISPLTPADIARVRCPCFSKPMQITLKHPSVGVKSTDLMSLKMPLVCTRVSARTSEPLPTAGGAPPGCLYMPGTDNFPPEVAIGAGKESEMEKCQYWHSKFKTGSHFFWVYFLFCALSGWTFLISCLGLLEQFFKDWRRKRDDAKEEQRLKNESAGKFNVNEALAGLTIGAPSADMGDAGAYGGIPNGYFADAAAQQMGADSANVYAPTPTPIAPAAYDAPAAPTTRDDMPTTVDEPERPAII